MHANLNLKSGNRFFTYIAEYEPNQWIAGDSISNIYVKNKSIVFKYPDTPDNAWGVDTFSYELDLENIPTQNIKMSYIDLYFPEYAIDLYRKSIGLIKYEVIIKIWIYGHEIILGNYLLNRINAIASERVRTFFNQKYYEFIRLPIVDPYELIYNDDWKHFRENVCYEPVFNDGQSDYNLNNTGSIIHITLKAVQPYNDSYIQIDEISSCQNSINITKHENDFLNLSIDADTNNAFEKEPYINCSVNFNQLYNGDICEYMKETYQTNFFGVKYGLVIGNNDNIYADIQTPVIHSNEHSKEDLTHCVFKKSSILKTGNFTNWVGWHEGINIRASVEFLTEDGEPMIYILSNIIPLTQELYKYIVSGSDFYGLYNINLQDIDMDNININVINKIEHKIYDVKNYEDSKANIAFPVFYKSLPITSLILHPDVNEHICINLDDYKSLTDIFMLQIEGIKFQEIGRIDAGIIFKIIGPNLPQKIAQGTYYVLDQESNLITSGKYKYEY
jgi:hypothetical protein